MSLAQARAEESQKSVTAEQGKVKELEKVRILARNSSLSLKICSLSLKSHAFGAGS